MVDAAHALMSEVGVIRRLLDPSSVSSSPTDVVDALLLRELSDVLDGTAAPSVRDSSMRSNLRFFVSMAYDIITRHHVAHN